MNVRPATMRDLSWIVMQLEVFASFYDTKTQFFGDVDHVVNLVSGLITDQVALIAEYNDGRKAGFITGFFMPHPYNPEIRVLQETFWWVLPEYRSSGAGDLLMNSFTEIGKERGANWILFSSIEGKSSVKDDFFIRRGFKLQEKSFLMEVL